MELYKSSPISIESESAIPCGICRTPSSNETKIVTLDGFKLFEGATINVLFENGNTFKNTPVKLVSLNVNSTGTIPIISVDGNPPGVGPYVSWGNNCMKTFTYSSALGPGHSGWYIHDAPWWTRHTYYRAGNVLDLGDTYHYGYAYDGKSFDIVINLPYEISENGADGQEASIYAEGVFNVSLTTVENGIHIYTASGKVLTESWINERASKIKYRLGQIRFTSALSGSETFDSASNKRPILVWFANNTTLTFS